MRRMKKILLPIFFLVVTLGSSLAAAAQCAGCDDWIITQSKGFLVLCGCDADYCYYCYPSEQ
jgi:hypothetical protein